MSGKYGLENERQSTGIDLKAEVQTGIVTGDIYKVQYRVENVNKRIESSQRIKPRNRELIRKFCDHYRLQGLSALRVVFYLNRFWNIARLATKNFDDMTKEDAQRLVMGVRDLWKRSGEPLSDRTITDHLAAIKTFWKWTPIPAQTESVGLAGLGIRSYLRYLTSTVRFGAHERLTHSPQPATNLTAQPGSA